MAAPTGDIADSEVFVSGLPREYLRFLQKHDPISRWEEINPLPNPIEVDGGRNFDTGSLPWIFPLVPQLGLLLSDIERVDAIAPLIGLRHAWTRCIQHGHILQAIDDSTQVRPQYPELIIDVGCTTGGLLHFLAKYWSRVPCIGFDLSSVALEVASYLQRKMRLRNKIHFLEESFSYLRPANLPDALGQNVPNGMIILCNMIEFLGRELSMSPAIDPWTAKAGLVAYWVGEGSAVYLCERHDNPRLLCDTIAANASWYSGTTMAVLKEFEAILTETPTPEDPIGEWVRQPGCVLGFFPPGWYPAGRPPSSHWIEI